MGVARVDKLTDAQKARMDEWADKWIEIGLRTGSADRERWERAAEACYGFAGLRWHGNVVWVESPLVLALAASTASHVLGGGAVGGAVRDAVRDAVDVAVGDAVDVAVRVDLGVAVGDEVGVAVRDAVRDAVDVAVGDEVGVAVRVAVGDAVGVAVGDAVGGAVDGAVRRDWHRVIGGQFWAGGWYWGGAWTSYFREICDLDLPGDMWERAKAYEATIESACWWWPHTQFVMVCERPTVIHRELVDPARPRGWGSHRLHCETGPAVAWPDGWGVWSWHGVRVPQHVIEQPDRITADEILAEENAEVRRVMIERKTPEAFLRESGATPVQQDDIGRLWRIDLPDDEPLVMVELENSTVEPDGSRKTYYLRVPPDVTTSRAAAAWTFDMSESDYLLAAQS